MAKVKQFNESNLQTISKDIDAALASVASKHGIQLTVNNIRYAADNFTVPLEGKVLDGELGVSSELASKISELGLIPEKNNKTLIDYKPRSPKYPFVYQEGDKKYKCTELQATKLFAA